MAKPAAKAAPQAAVNRDVMGAHAVYSPLPKIPDDLRTAAMDEVAVVQLRLLAYSLARRLGNGVDRRRTQAKTVTVE